MGYLSIITTPLYWILWLLSSLVFNLLTNTIFWVVGVLSLLTYYVPYAVTLYLRPQNLREKYNAQWALVTGGSSGIGKAVCVRLAQQGINVVIAALDDKLLQETTAELKKEFPKVEIRSVGVNMGADGYMDDIINATKDIPVQLVFNNAGYIVTGFFANLDLNRIMANYECNATAGVKITHHFSNRMIDEGKRGFICFTSSPAGRIPNPSSSLYGATKAFITEFAASIAPELHADGIDVMAVHPSPIASNFYKDAHDTGAINMFKKTAATPDVIARAMFAGAGRVVVYDQGYFPAVNKLLLLILDFNLFALVMTWTASFMGDFSKMRAERKQKDE